MYALLNYLLVSPKDNLDEISHLIERKGRRQLTYL
jgi:hypothetical protein